MALSLIPLRTRELRGLMKTNGNSVGADPRDEREDGGAMFGVDCFRTWPPVPYRSTSVHVAPWVRGSPLQTVYIALGGPVEACGGLYGKSTPNGGQDANRSHEFVWALGPLSAISLQNGFSPDRIRTVKRLSSI